MNPGKVDRSRLARLEDLPNIGKVMAEDLRLIGIRAPDDLVGQDPFDLYAALCEATGTRQDPCVLDVFMSVTRFMAGGPALPWWAFTGERKRLLLKRPATG
ncbi:MAG: helix-hairpin-helix domain-containing protein [Hydrogenophilaceae bacterium]